MKTTITNSTCIMASTYSLPPPSVNRVALRVNVSCILDGFHVLQYFEAKAVTRRSRALQRTASGQLVLNTREMKKPSGTAVLCFLGEILDAVSGVSVDTCRSWLKEWLCYDTALDTTASDPSHIAALWTALTIAEWMFKGSSIPEAVEPFRYRAGCLTYGLVCRVFEGSFQTATVAALLGVSELSGPTSLAEHQRRILAEQAPLKPQPAS